MAIYVSPPPPEKIIQGEFPSGDIDGVNTVFSTSEKFSMEYGGFQIKVYFNGVRQKLINDYLVSESVVGSGFDTITFSVAPRTGDNIIVDYEVQNF
jgi:hypothetical protein